MNNQTAQLLEQHFDTAFSAPDGIKKLRELILTLAMQGKLVPQDPDDPPASQLLKEIEAEKKRLVQEGTIKKPKPLPAIKPEEVPYEIPKSWEWVRIGAVTNISTGKLNANAAVDDGMYPFFTCSNTPSEIDTYSYNTEAVLLAGNGDFNIKYYRGKFDAYQRTYIIEPIKSELKHTYYGIKNCLAEITKSHRGSAIPYLRLADITHPLIPLPPLPEQHRIVTKIDQLMARCDELEKLRDEYEQKRRNVHTAALNQLLEAQTDDSFTDAWHFITQHFTELYSIKENVDELRKAILQLAVMGKLVPQDPDDPPASQLLKEIEAEKRRLVKEGVIKKPKALPKIKAEEVPYEIPESWEWCRIWDIAKVITSGSRDWAKYYSESGAVFVTMGNLSRGNYQLRMNTIRYVNPPSDGEGARTRLKENDLLISITGDVGNLGLIPPEFGEAYINQHTCLLRFMPHCRNLYFPELMRTALVKRQFDAPQRGIKNSLRLSDVGEILIPLPPLPEQHRIVAKIDQLMGMCDVLEEQIEAATVKKTRLLSALVAAV